MEKGLKFIFGVMFLLSVISLVSASYVANGVVFTSPIASATVTGTYILNVTNATTIFGTIHNCTFYAKSASTGNSSWTNIGFFTNMTISIVNGSFNSAILEDSNNYYINATCANSTAGFTDAVISGVIIQNTVPTAPSALSPADDSKVINASTQTFSATVNNKTTTSCTYRIDRYGSPSDPKSSSGVATDGQTTCSFTKTFSTTQDNGVYTWSIVASDGTDTTSTSADFVVQIPGTSGGLPPGTYTTQDGTTTSTSKDYTYYFVGGGIIIAILLIIYRKKIF